MIDCTTIKEVAELLETQVTSYWETHYTFGGNDNKQSEKYLSKTSIELIIINTIVPFLFAYGQYKMSEKLCNRAFAFLETLKAENNHIVRNVERGRINGENSWRFASINTIEKRLLRP